MTDGDDVEGAPPVAVLSYRIWNEKYGADSSVVGATYQINGHPFTVIGVAAPGFYGAKLAGWGMPDLWLPLTAELLIDGETARLNRPSNNFLDLIGRVRPGVNPRTLEAKLKVEFHSWLASHVPDMEPGEKQVWTQQTLRLVPGGAGVEVMRDQYEDGLKLLLIAAGCVLLVACANLANLMLARGLKDRAQTSIRVALGASRGRLVRGVLVESMLLAIIGGLFGVQAYMVERRTGEIGLRMALGADRGRVVGMVLAAAFWQVSLGLAIGIPAAIGAGKLMTVQLFGVQPWDPVMLMIATLLLGVGALVASMIPAWRAACVEPMAALRTE